MWKRLPSILWILNFNILEKENRSLKVRKNYLEQSNDTIAKQLEQEVEGAEDLASELKVTIENLSKLQASFDKLEVAQTNLRKGATWSYTFKNMQFTKSPHIWVWRA